MRNLLLLFVALFAFCSCKTTTDITVDSFAKAEKLKEYQTFKVVEDLYFDKRNEMLTQAFRGGLIDNGFEETVETPDFLVQAVLVTREFVQHMGSYSSPPPAYINGFRGAVSGGSSNFVVNKGMIGKAIFLIQDTQTNEIAWMGVGTGITNGTKQVSPENLDIALYELLATLN